MTKARTSRRQVDGVAVDPKHVGSSFDDFLREEGIYDQVHKAVGKRIAHNQQSMSPTAAAKVMGVTRAHLVDLIERGQVGYHRSGNCFRVTREDCQRYLATKGARES